MSDDESTTYHTAHEGNTAPEDNSAHPLPAVFPGLGGPPIPAAADPAKQHVWLRLDTRPVVFIGRHGACMRGLNRQVQQLGGRHLDVIVGNATAYWVYTLVIEKGWQKWDNGDGCMIAARASLYVPFPGEQCAYVGYLSERMEWNEILEMYADILVNKTFHHLGYSCVHGSNDLVAMLNVQELDDE